MVPPGVKEFASIKKSPGREFGPGLVKVSKASGRESYTERKLTVDTISFDSRREPMVNDRAPIRLPTGAA